MVVVIFRKYRPPLEGSEISVLARTRRCMSVMVLFRAHTRPTGDRLFVCACHDLQSSTLRGCLLVVFALQRLKERFEYGCINSSPLSRLSNTVTDVCFVVAFASVVDDVVVRWILFAHGAFVALSRNKSRAGPVLCLHPHFVVVVVVAAVSNGRAGHPPEVFSPQSNHGMNTTTSMNGYLRTTEELCAREA